jgi:uncharacterized membrane protein YhhN
MFPWILLTLVALAGLLVAEARSSQLGIYLCKPLASTGFVGAAVVSGAVFSIYGRIILLALLLSWLGDVLLIPAGESNLLAGLGSFLLAHVAFGSAFALRGLAWAWTAAALVVLAAMAFFVLRWLRPHLPARMRLPVVVYIAVITVMVTLAAGSVAAGSPRIILVGAVAFFLSDLSVANDRFVHKSLTNDLWGLPLYYAAQFCLAASVRA